MQEGELEYTSMGKNLKAAQNDKEKENEELRNLKYKMRRSNILIGILKEKRKNGGGGTNL